MSPNPSAKEFIQHKQSQLLNGAKKPIKMKSIDRKVWHYWKPVAGTYMVQSNKPDKVFELLRLERLLSTRISTGGVRRQKWGREREVEYRLGYYVVGRNGTKQGWWTWGRYCPLIPQKDFTKLFNKAKKEKTIL